MVQGGNYYLLGSYDADCTTVAFRIDKICDLMITDCATDDMTNTDLRDGVQSYLFAHPYMLTGKTERVQIKIRMYLLDEVIGTFGKNISICTHDPFHYRIGLNVGINDIVEWALRHAGYAEIISPDYVREKVVKRIAQTANDYGGNKQSISGELQNVEKDDLRKEQEIRYPYTLLGMIYGEWLNFSDDERAICDAFEKMFETLEADERSAAVQIYINGLSREDAAAVLEISAEEMMMRDASMLRKMRHPSRSKTLAKFIVSE